MSEYTIFPNAPITEALLDIQVELPKEIDLAKLESFQNNIKDDFPEKLQRTSYKTELRISPKGTESIPATSMDDGYLFRSIVQKKIVQARLDGFTFNKLKPYETWEKFQSEARKLWDLYFKLANPVKITRIALRYINRIEIPLPIKDFKEYILTGPDIAPNLPQGLAHFFIQLTIPGPDSDMIAIITEAIEDPTENQKLPLILDIDVFRKTIYTGNEAKMWDEIAKLRKFKNDIFFNSITEKTKELFK